MQNNVNGPVNTEVFFAFFFAKQIVFFKPYSSWKNKTKACRVSIRNTLKMCIVFFLGGGWKFPCGQALSVLVILTEFAYFWNRNFKFLNSLHPLFSNINCHYAYFVQTIHISRDLSILGDRSLLLNCKLALASCIAYEFDREHFRCCIYIIL